MQVVTLDQGKAEKGRGKNWPVFGTLYEEPPWAYWPVGYYDDTLFRWKDFQTKNGMPVKLYIYVDSMNTIEVMFPVGMTQLVELKNKPKKKNRFC